MVVLAWGIGQAQNFRVQLADFQSQGQVDLPGGSGPFPTVLLLHAGYPSDLDGTLMDRGVVLSRNLKDMAQFLVEKGFAVVRYNKRHVSSAGLVDQASYSRLTLEDFVKDAKTVLALLAANPKLDQNNLFVLGWSEGALVATQLGLQVASLRGVVLKGPPVVVQGRDTGLLEWVKSLRAPVLLLQGSSDTITPAVQAKRLEEALKSRPEGAYQARYYGGLGHGLGPASSSQFAPIAPEPLEDLVVWLKQNSKP